MASKAFSQLANRIEPPAISWLMQEALSRPNLISLAAGFTDNTALPVEETREAFQELFSSDPDSRTALQYGSTAGNTELRKLTAERLQHLDEGNDDQETYHPDQVILTHGSQQMLYLLTEILVDPGDIILCEDPTYFVYLGALKSHGGEFRCVPMDEQGMEPDALRHRLQELHQDELLDRVKMLYLVTYYQNPAGITTTVERKKKLLEVLREFEDKAEHPIYLVEDAAYRELRFEGPEIPSALVHKEFADRILYVGTYSKPFATGIRVGFGRLPRQVRDLALMVKANHDFGTSHLLQQLLVRALRNGSYANHVDRLRNHYQEKAGVMLTAMEKEFPASLKWRKPCGGLSLWAWGPTSLDTSGTSALFQSAMDREVLFVPGSLCYAPDETRALPNHEMRLSFGAASKANIEEGIHRLGKALHEIL